MPQDHAQQHRSNIEQLEKIVADKLEVLSLDAKLEFILCCKMVGHGSLLEKTIMREANTSAEYTGTYLADGTESTLQNSEHRNALYLMVQHLSDLR